jgi:hypothetical protein
MSEHSFHTLRPWLVRIGIGALVPSLIYFVLGLMGLVATEWLSIGANSGLRAVASIAVLGCVMAAIGYWDED